MDSLLAIGRLAPSKNISCCGTSEKPCNTHTPTTVKIPILLTTFIFHLSAYTCTHMLTKNFIYNTDKSKMQIRVHRNSLIKLSFNFTGSTVFPEDSVKNTDSASDLGSLLTKV